MDGYSPPPTSVDTIVCNACGAVNPSQSLFCSRCTAPLAVAGLQELDVDDLRLCRSALFQIFAESTRATPEVSLDASHDELLWRAYLSAFWLRPETALILYAEAMAIRSLADVTDRPWLDLGCGDGVHAALYSGWRFDPIFDAFQSLDLGAKDIYHYWSPANFIANITHRGQPFVSGIDIKETAVARAAALGAFCAVSRADATHLPLADDSVKTIFSNMLRDLGDPLPTALRECRRVLCDDGVLLLSAMTPAYARSLYFMPAARNAEEEGRFDEARRLIRLDRGRSVFCQRQLSIPQWESLLREQGLRIVDVRPIVSPAVIRFWDVGLRPFSPALLRQRQIWADAGVLASLKSSVAEFLSVQLEPLVRQLNTGLEHCMNILAITKA